MFDFIMHGDGLFYIESFFCTLLDYMSALSANCQ